MNQYKFSQFSSDFPLFPYHTSYLDDCLDLAGSKLMDYNSISEFEKDLSKVNTYENLHEISEPKNLVDFDAKTLKKSDYIKTWKCILDGKLFAEHTAAGEATRLNLGTKYLINIQKDLSFDKIVEMISQERGAMIPEKSIKAQVSCNPSDLLPLSLGVRHMLQYSFDIYNLSKSLGYDPEEVLLKQKILIILNEDTADIIINEFIKHKFYGFSRYNIMFMIQKSYHGINLKNKEVFYDRSSPKRLHNHGYIAIEQTMHNQIFYISKNKGRNYLGCDQFGEILKTMEIKISYNIEDLSYLTGSIDYEGIALTLKKNKENYNMLMEVLPNNPEAPQKGGMAAFDPILAKDVMIESFQLNGIKNHKIKFLNKNVNYYPKPFIAWEAVRKQGLNMHITVKDDFIYFQPVIGDINFLVKTAIFTRKNAVPIKAWKSATTTPLAINCMHMQDLQKGFKGYARMFLESE